MKEHHGSENGYSQTSSAAVPGLLQPVTIASGGVTWAEAVAGFLAAAIDNVGTRRAYGRHLARAGRLFGEVTVGEVTGADLATYRAAVLDSGLSPSTQAQSLTAVRSFLSWTGSMRGSHLPAEVIALALRRPRATVQARYNVVTDREIAAMFEAAPGARERALLGILLGAGLRVAETASLSVCDIVEGVDEGVSLFVRQGKGRKDRIVPIGADVDLLLRDYLVETKRFLGDNGPIFLARDRGVAQRIGPGLSTRALSRLVTDIAMAAGIAAKRVTPHSLRHTFAIRCLRGGGSVVAVARLLGHANIATTQRYVDHLATAELRAAVPALPLLPSEALAS